jgi:hypothetical protein
LEGRNCRIETRQKHTAFTPRWRQKQFREYNGLEGFSTTDRPHSIPFRQGSPDSGNKALALFTLLANIFSS